ncbi:MAG: twin-arginine translocation pathway signal, partial [Alsobacter sp.]
MTHDPSTRRTVLATGAALAGAALLTGAPGLLMPARAQALAPTPTMRGGANNYIPGAPIVSRIGGGGFWMSGTVRRAGDGAPLAGVRIQVWAHT